MVNLIEIVNWEFLIKNVKAENIISLSLINEFSQKKEKIHNQKR